MSTFITWQKTNDTEAREAFESITGIAVQTSPAENEAGTHYMVGVKITLQQYQALNETELFTLKNWTPPSWWVPKVDIIVDI